MTEWGAARHAVGMPEEQKSPYSPEKIEIQAAPDTANTADDAPPFPLSSPPPVSGGKPADPEKAVIPSYVGFGLLIAALLVVLFVVTNKKRMQNAGVDSKAVDALSADLEASRSDLNRQRMAMGLRPLEGGSESIDEIAKRLNKDANTLVALANSFQKLLEEKNAALDAKNSELLRSEQLRQSIAAELSRKDGQISRLSMEGSDGELAKREVADLKAQRDALRADLAKAREQMNKVGGQSNDDYALLQKRYDEARRSSDFFEKRVKELEGELAKLRIFAKSENELLPAAVELFRTLRGLEGKKDSDNMTAYSDIGVKLGARVLKTLDFPTGSASMTEVDQAEVPALINQAEDGDLILVVGYASTTGNVEANRVLSSDRATAAAQAISAIKRPGQLVQAVYIGQTNRFSSAAPERNQICEVWHIKKK